MLLAAIYGAWEFYQKKKVQRAAENALIIEQNEQSKIEAAEKNAKLKEKGAREAQARKEARLKMIAEIQAANKELTPQLIKPIPELFVKCPELEEVRKKCYGLVDKIQKKFRGKSQSQFLQETEELRGFYRNKLTEIKTTLQTKGMNDQARTVDQELNATKVTGQAFVDYILGNN